MPFLSLPTELRFKIYVHIAVPREAPLSDYAGLYLSCRQVKAELDHEGTRLLKAHLLKVAAKMPGLRVDFPVPMDLPEMQHIHIIMDTNSWDGTTWTNSDDLHPIFSLHLFSITITYPRVNGENDISVLGHYACVFSNVWQMLGKHFCITVLTRKNVVDIPADRGDFILARLLWSLDADGLDVGLQDGWSFRWVEKTPAVMEATWEKE